MKHSRNVQSCLLYEAYVIVLEVAKYSFNDAVLLLNEILLFTKFAWKNSLQYFLFRTSRNIREPAVNIFTKELYLHERETLWPRVTKPTQKKVPVEHEISYHLCRCYVVLATLKPLVNGLLSKSPLKVMIAIRFSVLFVLCVLCEAAAVWRRKARESRNGITVAFCAASVRVLHYRGVNVYDSRLLG